MSNNNKLITQDFSEVLSIITSAKERVWAQVNKALIELYWEIGRYISCKCNTDEWGMATVTQLAKHIQESDPNITGFSARNIWRMRQFYQT